MKLPWTLRYDARVTSYLIGLRDYGTEIRRAVRSLADDPEPEDAEQIGDNIYLWRVASHHITYLKNDERHELTIALVEPITSE